MVPDQIAMFQANRTSMLSDIILVACINLGKLAETPQNTKELLKAIHTKGKV
jgi:hypothetical protein